MSTNCAGLKVINYHDWSNKELGELKRLGLKKVENVYGIVSVNTEHVKAKLVKYGQSIYNFAYYDSRFKETETFLFDNLKDLCTEVSSVLGDDINKDDEEDAMVVSKLEFAVTSEENTDIIQVKIFQIEPNVFEWKDSCGNTGGSCKCFRDVEHQVKELYKEDGYKIEKC